MVARKSFFFSFFLVIAFSSQVALWVCRGFFLGWGPFSERHDVNTGGYCSTSVVHLIQLGQSPPPGDTGWVLGPGLQSIPWLGLGSVINRQRLFRSHIKTWEVFHKGFGP